MKDSGIADAHDAGCWGQVREGGWEADFDGAACLACKKDWAAADAINRKR